MRISETARCDGAGPRVGVLAIQGISHVSPVQRPTREAAPGRELWVESGAVSQRDDRPSLPNAVLRIDQQYGAASVAAQGGSATAP